MKNNKKMTLKTKDEKRRLAFEKRNVKKEQNFARYGAEGGSALVMAKTTEFNRRIIAAVLALVFVLTTIVVGYNFAARADDPDEGFKMFESIDDSGFVTRKGIRHNLGANQDDTSDDTYDLRLEAYATEQIATKTIDASKTPLDVVLVMDESSSMETEKDVWTGGYTEVNGPFNIKDAEGKYYRVGDNYYPVHYELEGYAEVQENGTNSVKNSWTAVQANQYFSQLSQQGRGLYYGSAHNSVYAVKTKTYPLRSVQTIDMGASYMNHSYLTGHYYSTDFYVYVPHDASEADGAHSCWHRIYYREDGYTGDGYYYTFYYYTNSEEGSGASFSNGSAGDLKGSGSSQVRLLTDYHACATWGTRVGIYFEKDGYIKYWDNDVANGTDGNIYEKSSRDSDSLNYLYTVDEVLACPEPNSNYSHFYEGPLCTDGYRLFYQTDPDDDSTKQYVGSSVYKLTDGEAYNDSLYEKSYITRTKAQQLAATELAQKIAENSTEDKDHYIAVVGSKESDAVKTNLVEATANDDNPANSVNDIIDTALDSLTSDGGSIANGLVNAQSVFASKTLDPADSRKRIVVIFTDDTEADSNALSEAAKLKDTYNASVYVVGYPDSSSNQSIDNYLSHLSSEYFATATNPIVETENDDGKTYHYYGTDKASILSAFNKIATEIQSPITKVALGPKNSVLRDVISKYFVFPEEDGELDTANINANIVSVSAIADDGNITWGGSEPFALKDKDPNKNLTVTSNSDGSTTIDITGFDYNSNYVSDSRTDGSLGKKIVVEITGLRLKGNIKADSDRRLYSNAIESGIYKIGAPGADGTDKKDADMLFASFPRPFLDETSNMVPAGSTGVTGSNGSVVNKYLTPNSNGKYDLTLEAYTTETNVTRTEKIPTDFVVVVDQSGSMAYEDMPTGYSKVSGTKTIEEIAKGTYYVEGDDGNYYRVYPTRNYLYHYYPANSWYVGDILKRVGANLSWFQGESEQSFDYENQFYFRENDGSYRPIKLTIAGKLGTYYNKFSYVDGSGNTVVFNRDNTQYGGIVYANLLGKFGWGPTIDPGEAGYSFIDGIVRGVYHDDNAYTFSQVKGSGLFSWIDINTGMYVNYPMYDRNVGYTELQYRDVNGIVHKLAATNGKDSWEFCDEDGNALTSQSGTKPKYNNLYVPSGTQTRLEALKKALGDFAKAVADETQDKDFNEGKVDNRIAIVGFSSAGFSNTEVLTKTDATLPEAKNGWSKATADENPQEYYGKALVSATNGDTGNVNGKITAAIDALTAKGGTQPEDGLSMAYEILDKRTEKQYVIKSSNRQGEVVDRNTIVIFFTDGQPGDYQTSDQYKEANEVVEAALPIKKQLGAKLFSIGVFGESDGNPLTYNANNDWTTGNNGEPIQIKNLPRDQWKYLGGWMETYQDGWDYYCLRRQWRPNNAEYTATPNDTIYDYMSVTSSNYPNAADYIAPTWLTGDFEGTYLDATDGVRQKTSESNKNSYYRMASNQDTLVAAFKQAVTLIDNKISDNAVLDDSAILRDILKENTFVSSGTTTVKGATVVGTMDNNNVVTFDPNTTEDITSSLTKVPTTDDNGILTAIDVKGFNYLENYIKYGKEAKDGLKENQGKKLVVTITDVYPTGDVVSKESENKLVLSNEDNSGLYAVNNGNAFLQKDFPTPGITRHQYKLDVGDYNKDATFNVKATIVDNDGNPVNALDDVIVVLPNGSRALYSNVGAQTVRGMKNGDCFYFENVPSGYEIKTEVAPTDAAYIYSIRYDNSGDLTQMTFGESEPHQFDYNDHVINITARLNNKKVTIREQTIGAYGNISEVFDELITLEIPEISVDGTPEAFTYDCTYNGESYTAVFTKTSGPTDGKYNARLSALNKTGADSITITDGKLPMKHDDEITFTVPTGTKVIVSEADTKNYEVVYYTGQDQLNADQITLTDANGTLLDGSFDLEFIPVTGTEAPNLTLSVENGIVSGADRVDLSLYQAAKFTSSDEVSNVVLNLNGTQIPFSKQQDDEDSYYLATYKTISAGSQGSVTITKDDMDILIVNAKSDIPKEGVADSDNHNRIIFILAALGGIVAISVGIFLWKKKDEFVEE